MANHLNDITKTDPDTVVEILQRWCDSGRQYPCEMGYIVRHATRTAVKAGHPPTLALLGVGTGPQVTLAQITVPSQVDLGAELALTLSLLSAQDTEVVVDYTLDLPGPLGKLSRRNRPAGTASDPRFSRPGPH